jgi:small-conductance mechanosensitive channel
MINFVSSRIAKRFYAACFALFLFISALAIVSRAAPDADVLVSPDRLIQFLNQSIDLYHQCTLQQQIVSEPQEQLLLYDNRQLAGQSVRLAFEFARDQLNAMPSEPASTAAPRAGASAQYNSLRKMLSNLDKQLQDTQAEEDSDRQKLASATGARRAKLQTEVSELQAEIALAQARRDAVHNMLDFVASSASTNLSASGLRAQIDALASSVPAASSAAAGSGSRGPAPFTIVGGKAAPSGIWDLTSDLFGLSSKLRTVDSMIADTDGLLRTSDEIRTPFITRLRSLSKQGNQLATQADTADRAMLSQERQQLDGFATQFTQLAAAVIPLSKQRVLLNLYRKNLVDWRGAIDGRYRSDLQSLGIHLGALAVFLGFLFGLSALWRRAIYRYVHEPRRRHQFMLLRKLVFWFVIAVIIAIVLAGKIASFATFAGLVGAGLALALQSVLTAVIGYFFLIGKFGIRVGDRVEVSGIVGDVIDIGLVRFHLMELGSGATPTGRLVALSNSIVFQPAAGLIKQIPGASFAWHQVTLTVPRAADFGAIRKTLLGAVESVLQDYRGEIQEVYEQMEKTGILIKDRGLHSNLDLHLTSGEIQATIRYPVDLQHANEIDARVSRELLTALERDFKLQGAAGPSIRLKNDAPAGATSD